MNDTATFESPKTPATAGRSGDSSALICSAVRSFRVQKKSENNACNTQRWVYDCGMKTKINLDWTANLYEVGGPIRDGAKEIGWQVERADKALADAKKLHGEQMTEIKRQADRIEAKVSELWTAEEIAAAKRGVMLADGMECVV